MHAVRALARRSTSHAGPSLALLVVLALLAPAQSGAHVPSAGAVAHAAAFDFDAWFRAPIIVAADVPELDAARGASVAHWRATPGIRTVEQACRTYPAVRRLDYDPASTAGWGMACGAGSPGGGIWIEEAFLATLPDMPPDVRGRSVCYLLEHELGHALDVGARDGGADDHRFRGDAGNVMEPGSWRVTAECAAAFPELGPVAIESRAGRVTHRQARRAVRRTHRRWRIRVDGWSSVNGRTVEIDIVSRRSRRRAQRHLVTRPAAGAPLRVKRTR